MSKLWPFKTANDDFYQSIPEKETIYDALGTLPDFSYDKEVSRYNEWRWRRGLIQTILPVATASSLLGFIIGFRQSRIEGRYVGRWRVLARYMGTGALVGVTSAAVHHLLVVRNHYEEKIWHPMVAGMSGSTIITVATQTGTIAVGVMAGAFVGTLYSLSCYAMKWYHKRTIQNFLEVQRQMQVPVHKISPELQPAYRAYLFDHRPIEEHTEARRKAILVSRSEDDYRLDADAFLVNMTPEVYDWVNFPDWWPLKYPFQTEEQSLIMQRQRDEEITRRTAAFLTIDGGAAMKRRMRGSVHRDQ